MRKTYTSATIFYCVILILMDFIGLTISIVIFPELLLSDSHSILPLTMPYNHKFLLLGVLLALYPLGQFFGASTFGKLSDYFGRRAILLITLLGTLLGFVLTAISIMNVLPILLFASRLVTGLFAGNAAVAQAVLVDVSDENTKGRNISFGQAAMGTAYILGPVFGAYLSAPTIVSWFNFSTPFWFFCPIFFAFILFTIFCFSDTLEKSEKINVKLYTNIQQVYQGFKLKQIRGAIFIWFCFCFGWWLFEAFIPAYLFKNFNFTTIQIGHLLTYNGSLFVLSQMLIVSQVIKKVGPESLVKGALLFASIAMVSLAYVPNDFVYLSMAVFVLGMSFSIPGIITSISNLNDSAAVQGQIMGIIASIQAFATMLVMLLGGLFNLFHSSATIISGGIICFLAWFMYLTCFDKVKNRVKSGVADEIVSR